MVDLTSMSLDRSHVICKMNTKGKDGRINDRFNMVHRIMQTAKELRIELAKFPLKPVAVQGSKIILYNSTVVNVSKKSGVI